MSWQIVLARHQLYFIIRLVFFYGFPSLLKFRATIIWCSFPTQFITVEKLIFFFFCYEKYFEIGGTVPPNRQWPQSCPVPKPNLKSYATIGGLVLQLSSAMGVKRTLYMKIHVFVLFRAHQDNKINRNNTMSYSKVFIPKKKILFVDYQLIEISKESARISNLKKI